MDLLKLLERQLSKRAVGTLVLNRLSRFREVFFEDDQAYLVDEPFSGKVAVEELFARHIIGERLSLAKFETILYSADLTQQLLPEILRDQGVLDGEALQAVAEEQILEEIVDLFFHNTTSFHFQEGRVPEHLLGRTSLVAEYSVPIERLTSEYARRVERRREIGELIPSDQEIFVVTEAGMVHKETRDANYALRSVFNLLDGMRDLGSVADDSCLFAFHVYSLIDDALRRGHLKKTIHPELRGFSTSRLSPQEAEQYLPLLKNAVKYGADELAARERLAVLYEKLGRVEDAVIQFNFVGDTLYRMDRAPKAIKAYQKALELKPGEPLLIDKMASVYVRLAQEARARDDKALAMRLLANVLRMRPDDLATFARLTSLYLEEGDMKAVSEAIDIVRTYASKISDADLAIKACRAIVARVPRDIGLRKKLVNIYLDSGRDEDGAREMRILAGLYVKAGNVQMAQSLLDKVSRLNGEEPPARTSPATSVRRAHASQNARRRQGRGVVTPVGAVLLLLVLVYQLTALLAWRDIERRYAHAESLSRSGGQGSQESRAELDRVSRACDRYLELYPISTFGRDVRRIRSRLGGGERSRETDPGRTAASTTRRKAPEQGGRRARGGSGPSAGKDGATALGARSSRSAVGSIKPPAAAAGTRTLPDSDKARALLDRAAELERSGGWWEAAALYRQAVHRFPRVEIVSSVRIPVRVESHPQGAEVLLVEGRHATESLGVTPLVRHLEIGGYEILEFRKSGHESRRVEVTERDFDERRSPLLVVLPREPSRTAKLPQPLTAPAVLEGRLLHCGLERGTVATVDAVTGRVATWIRPNSTAEHVSRRPLARQDGLYTVWNDAHVIRLRWAEEGLTVDGVFRLPGLPAECGLAGGRGEGGFMVGTVQSTLLGFDGAAGEGPVWSLETPGEVTAALQLSRGTDADASFVVGTENGILMKFVVVETTALVEWKRRVSNGPIRLLSRIDEERLAVGSGKADSLTIVPASGRGKSTRIELPEVVSTVIVESTTQRAYAVLADATLVWAELGAGQPGRGRLALDDFIAGEAYELVAVGDGELGLLYDKRRAFVLLRLDPPSGPPRVSWFGRLGEPIHTLQSDAGRVVAVGNAGKVCVWESD